MVVSENPYPPREEFESLLGTVLYTLKEESEKHPKFYLNLGGTKLEDKAMDILTDHAKGTPFEGSIEKWSAQWFPDIVANKYYGVEVKTSKSSNWTSTGSSVAEGTRVQDVERIFMLFGKLCDPVDFKCRPYEECLSEVVVTHSPRYLIDMRLKEGNTIFDKMGVPYDTLRKNDPIKTVLKYYRGIQREGQRPWWLGEEEERSNFFITDLAEVKGLEFRRLKSEAFCLFPELLGNKQTKYKRLMLYLASKGFVSSNLRDNFSAGGSVDVNFDGTVYQGVHKVVKKVEECIELIPDMLYELSASELSYYWEKEVASDRFLQWTNLIMNSSREYMNGFPLGEYLKWIYGVKRSGRP